MKEMTFNQQMIKEYAQRYKELYKEKFNIEPTNWWGFTVWLTNCTPASNFTQDDIDIAISELGIK